MKLLIKEQIEASGLKKSFIARELGVDKNTVTRWVNGDSIPNFEKAVELSKVLGIDLNNLWEES